MYIDVFSHTVHTPFWSFIIWQLVSMSSVGHHQAIIQKCEFKQKRKYYKLGNFPIFYIKNILILWRQNFLLNFNTPVYKMWIIQEPKNVALWNKRHFEEEKTESMQHV
jgi:hypothetical protein